MCNINAASVELIKNRDFNFNAEIIVPQNMLIHGMKFKDIAYLTANNVYESMLLNLKCFCIMI